MRNLEKFKKADRLRAEAMHHRAMGLYFIARFLEKQINKSQSTVSLTKTEAENLLEHCRRSAYAMDEFGIMVESFIRDDETACIYRHVSKEKK